eukprot:TRINITY_DN96130_c0_g1_i1.p1 TRINITY_DN96130_c0_g1~~TRINITY_DN96130_c0_g1_i1.p1  ORF type:complete len:475 (+),score=38.91 TRINITY_DN96130_c0_g1_i1:44-1426(+)
MAPCTLTRKTFLWQTRLIGVLLCLTLFVRHRTFLSSESWKMDVSSTGRQSVFGSPISSRTHLRPNVRGIQDRAMQREAVFSKQGLETLLVHEYHPGSYTPLDQKLSKYWTRLADSLPQQLAPNIVTLFGFLPMAVSYVLCWTYSPGYALSAPRWVILFALLSLFVYQTSDAVDGKHARKIGMATPVGQLFDHGFDCLSSVAIHALCALIFLPGTSQWGLAVLMMLQTGFFMAQWSERVIGTLPTSYGVIGVTESQLTIMMLLFGAACAGPRLTTIVSRTVQSPFGLGLVSFGVAGCQVWSAFVATISSICAVKTFRHAWKEGGTGGVTRAFKDLVPLLSMNVLIFSWESQMLARAPQTICFMSAMLYFYYTVQLILFTMAKMPFPATQYTLLPYAGLVLCSHLFSSHFGMLDVALKVVAAGTAANVLWWLKSAVFELKNALGIDVFSVKRRTAVRTPAHA